MSNASNAARVSSFISCGVMHPFSHSRRWSLMRKGRVVGAVAGFGVTVTAFGISYHMTEHDNFAYLMFAVNLLLCAPALLICQVLGIKAVLSPETSRTAEVGWYTLVVASNMTVVALIGTAVGWVRSQWPARRGRGDAATEDHRGLLCVRCRAPLGLRVRICPTCGWTQPDYGGS
jgi:hypothetical protein